MPPERTLCKYIDIFAINFYILIKTMHFLLDKYYTILKADAPPFCSPLPLSRV